MEYSGLTTKYPVNRPLTGLDRERQLHQGTKLNVELAYQLSVISVDSESLELVDKYYAWKGVLTTFVFVASTILACLLGGMTLISLTTPGRMAEDWPFLLALYGMASPLAFLLYWVLRREIFAFTHYPIRLERASQMVHVFRLDGTVLSAPWKDIFFCLDTGQMNNWNIRGHVLTDDNETVLETFALAPVGAGEVGRQVLLGYWEFVRGYMEDGEAGVTRAVKLAEILVPIANQRERAIDGFRRMHAESSGGPVVFMPIIAAIGLALLPARWLAIQSSKVPKWPANVLTK